MDQADPDHFEMRRLESLSNTIFGVAMTLLAYDLPRSAQLSAVPSWAEIYHIYAGRLVALVLSFIVAGLFWFSHHRRLVRQPYGDRSVVIINLFFLLSIILLPVTTSLDGSHEDSSVIAVLYGLNLNIAAALNAWLWWRATHDEPGRRDFRIALFPLLLLLPGTVIAGFAPEYDRYLWLLAFGIALIRRPRRQAVK